MSPIRLPLFVLFASLACRSAPEAPPRSSSIEAASAPEVLDEEGTVLVDVILAEVRVQFEGTWEPFYVGAEPTSTQPKFPGLQVPLDIIRMLEQVAAKDMRITSEPSDAYIDFAQKVRARFDGIASTTYAPYTLGTAYLTGGGGHWQALPPPPPPPPEPLFAFRVNRPGTNEPYKRLYLPGGDANADGPADGHALYWVLFRYTPVQERTP